MKLLLYLWFFLTLNCLAFCKDSLLNAKIESDSSTGGVRDSPIGTCEEAEWAPGHLLFEVGNT